MHVPYQNAVLRCAADNSLQVLAMAQNLHEIPGYRPNEETFMAALKTVLAAIMLAVLAACTSTAGVNRTAELQPGFGVIENISVVPANDSIGIGAVLGGVAGGLLGNQIGSGSGQTAATIAGVAGGAYAGQQIEKGRNSKREYQLGVRMENGFYQSVTQDTNPFQVGDKVQIIDGKIRRR
jgi:outer membrane lipoprotein SlyB